MSTLDTLEICFRANLDGVDRQLNALIGQLDRTAASSARLDSAMEAAGRAAADGLRRGVGSGASAVRAAFQQVMRSAAAAPDVSAAQSAGAALGDGFAAGIRSRKSAAMAAAGAVAAAAAAKMRSVLQIHSPSKVTRGFGEHFGKGFSMGVLDGRSGAERAGGGLARSAAEGLKAALGGGLSADFGDLSAALGSGGLAQAARGGALPDAGGGESLDGRIRAAVEDALGGVTLTVPLNVDGMRLGEASIRGINAVTRSTGRVLLNL